MAKGYSLQALGVLDGTAPPVIGDGAQVNARKKSTNFVITGASLVTQGIGAINDTIVLYRVPAYAQFQELCLQTDTTFTGVTLQVGVAGNATKYGSVVAPAANVKQTFRPAAVRTGGAYTTEEEIILTVTGAALPTSFNLEGNVDYTAIN